MKKLLLVLFAISLTSTLFAQDVIITKESKKINAKILEVNLDDIKYKNLDNLDGPTFMLRKSDLVSILFQNGDVELYNLSAQTQAPSLTGYKSTPNFLKAQKMRNAGIGCFSAGLATSTLGIILVATSNRCYYTYGYYENEIYYDNYYYPHYYNNYAQETAGATLFYLGSASTITGIVLWAVGQSKMNKIKKVNANGISLFENSKMQLNMAVGGNNVGLNLRF